MGSFSIKPLAISNELYNIISQQDLIILARLNANMTISMVFNSRYDKNEIWSLLAIVKINFQVPSMVHGFL